MYKSFCLHILGQASSSSAEAAGLLAEGLADLAWGIVSESSNKAATEPGRRNYSTVPFTKNFDSTMGTFQDRKIPGY